VKAKLEQQHRQFKELEMHFEDVTGKLEAELRAEKELNDEIVASAEKEKNEALRKQEVEFAEKLKEVGEAAGTGTRVAELEEALRESVNITAEREFVFGQQRKKCEAIEEDVSI